jgi:acetyl esterase/lipase
VSHPRRSGPFSRAGRVDAGPSAIVGLVGLALTLLAMLFLGGPAGPAGAAGSPTPSVPNSTLPPSTPQMQVIPQTAYYSGGPTFDAYLPRDGRPPHPALIMVHGGGWQGGDKDEFAPFAVRAVTEEHWAAFAVNYRLDSHDKASWPDELHDVQAAIRFIVAHASTYDIDPAQVMILGGSAGGNLMALVSEVGTVDPIKGHPVGADPTLVVPIVAAALWSPPVDLADLVASDGRPPTECRSDKACDFIWSAPFVADYLGCAPSDCPQIYADASPITWVSSRTAPSFVAASTDELVPIRQVKAYVADLRRAGVTVKLDQIPGTLHSVEYGGEAWAPTVAFLQARLAGVDPAGSSGSGGDLSTADVAVALTAFVLAGGLVVVALMVLRRRDRRPRSG